MSALREAAQQALAALEWHLDCGTWGADLDGCAAALRAALEQECYVVTGNEFHGAPPEPYANWGEAMATMLDAGVIEGLRISALEKAHGIGEEVWPATR